MKFLRTIKKHLARLFGEEYTPNPRIPLPRKESDAFALTDKQLTDHDDRSWRKRQEKKQEVVGEDDLQPVSGVEASNLRYVSFDPSFDTMSQVPVDDEFVQKVIDWVHAVEDLDPSDYHYGDPITGWYGGKPNPHPEGTAEHDKWAHEQDMTSF